MPSVCQDAFLKLHKNGNLIEQVMTQLYCENDKRCVCACRRAAICGPSSRPPSHPSFLADRFVEGTCPKCGYTDARGDQCDSCTNPLDPLELVHPRCVLCSNRPVTKETSHLSIALDKLQPEIQSWVDESSSKGKWSSNTVGMTKGWLKEGLLPRNVTRDLSWGVPVPLEGWENKVMYVWVSGQSGLSGVSACPDADRVRTATMP